MAERIAFTKAHAAYVERLRRLCRWWNAERLTLAEYVLAARDAAKRFQEAVEELYRGK